MVDRLDRGFPEDFGEQSRPIAGVDSVLSICVLL